MPVLKEYSESSDQSGCYIHAPISDRGHPLPLQTPKITEEIYRELGYEPRKKGHDGGVNVPNELTWILYEVGLHWTKNSGPQTDATDIDPNQFQDENGPVLNDDDIQTILHLTEEYAGQYETRVKNLRGELGGETESSGGGDATGLEEIFEPVSTEPSFPDDVETKLENWEPRNVLGDDEEPENMFSGMFSTNRSEHRVALSKVPKLSDHLDEYGEHAWDIKSISASKIGSSVNSRLRVTFVPYSIPDIRHWTLYDYRRVEEQRDFEIRICLEPQNPQSYMFEIRNNLITDFSIDIHEWSINHFDVPSSDHAVYNRIDQGPEEIMHTLVSDFSRLVPILAEFFDDFPAYDLEITELGSQSAFLE